MPLPVIPSVCRVAVRGTCPSGQRWVNVVHVHKAAAGAWVAGDIAVVQPLLVRLWKGAAFGAGADWMGNCNTTCTIDDMTYTPLDGSSPSTVQTVALAGVSASVSLPSEVAFVLTLRTPIRGRRARGRIYLPPPVNGAMVAPGVLQATSVTATVAQATGLQTALIAAGFSLEVTSYKFVQTNAVTVFSMDNKGDVQRGRK